MWRRPFNGAWGADRAHGGVKNWISGPNFGFVLVRFRPVFGGPAGLGGHGWLSLSILYLPYPHSFSPKLGKSCFLRPQTQRTEGNKSGPPSCSMPQMHIIVFRTSLGGKHFECGRPRVPRFRT